MLPTDPDLLVRSIERAFRWMRFGLGLLGLAGGLALMRWLDPAFLA